MCFVMSRSLVFGLVLLIFIVTSQSEWKEHPSKPLDSASVVSRQQTSVKHEVTKSQIISSQKKKIRYLEEFAEALKSQLEECNQFSDDKVNEMQRRAEHSMDEQDPTSQHVLGTNL